MKLSSASKYMVSLWSLEKLLSSRSASLELQGIIEQINLVKDRSRQVIHEFGDVSKSIEGIKFSIKKVTPSSRRVKTGIGRKGGSDDCFREHRCWYRAQYWASQHSKGEYHTRHGTSRCPRSCRIMEEWVRTLSKDLFWFFFHSLHVTFLLASSWGSPPSSGVHFYSLLMKLLFLFSILYGLMNVSSKECLILPYLFWNNYINKVVDGTESGIIIQVAYVSNEGIKSDVTPWELESFGGKTRGAVHGLYSCGVGGGGGAVGS